LWFLFADVLCRKAAFDFGHRVYGTAASFRGDYGAVSQNRSDYRYLEECINVRDAVNRLEVAAERTRREGLEAQSERKRQALRRTQEAAAEARRSAINNQRRRKK
jgi:cell division septum initiation protein DivIVA